MNNVARKKRKKKEKKNKNGGKVEREINQKENWRNDIEEVNEKKLKKKISNENE